MLMKPVSKCTNDDLYFKSKAERLIFALVELDGTNRCKILNLSDDLYDNKKLAKQWRDRIYNIILNSNNPNVTKAINTLNCIYYTMIDWQ